MSHDLYASWAASEMAVLFSSDPAQFFATPPSGSQVSIFASREAKSQWPLSDGVLAVEVTAPQSQFNIAVELKRHNEGVHGVLTAIGQAHAYLHKGYAGAVIVIPASYDTLSNPGAYVRDVLDNTKTDLPISVVTYETPDTTAIRPFAGKLAVVRNMNLNQNVSGSSGINTAQSRAKTQWAHVREGSTEVDAFFRYLQFAKLLSGNLVTETLPKLPQSLIDAIETLQPGADPYKYLSNTTADTLSDRSWRAFWFKYVLFEEALCPWKQGAKPYEVMDVSSGLKQANGEDWKKFFVGKSNSPKNKVVDQLLQGQINEIQAWEKIARNYRDRAHSYREDIDSGLAHIGLLDADGRPTDIGYRLIDACERTGDPFSGTPQAIFGATILRHGEMGALLHYIYKLSENRFNKNPLDFTSNQSNTLKFQQDDYLNWIEDELSATLKVMAKSTARGGTPRKPLQAELALLRRLDFVAGFRVGVGLIVNWPKVQESMDYVI